MKTKTKLILILIIGFAWGIAEICGKDLLAELGLRGLPAWLAGSAILLLSVPQGAWKKIGPSALIDLVATARRFAGLTTSAGRILGITNIHSFEPKAQEKYEFTVSQDGSGDYTKIQDAIDACEAFPSSRVTIHVKNGIYKEKVKVPSWNTRLSLIGESKEKTIITNNDYFKKIDRGCNSTFFTYTLKIESDDFYAEKLTVENTSGPVGQAVALHVEGDGCIFMDFNIKGYQDTLYSAGQNSRQFFCNCHIEGTTDYIFGAATALFQNCEIHSKSNSHITAASTPQGKTFGFVFKNCKLTAAEGVDKVYLGRPWRDDAKVVFINCEMGAHILPKGWSVWPGTNRDQTAYYAEYGNRGPGAAIENRVSWSRQLSQPEAEDYTTERILAPTKQNLTINWLRGGATTA